LFEITDVEVVVILIVVLVIVYFAGSYWKHRQLTSLAHWFEDRFGKIARIQFAKQGHAGLSIKCEMKDKTHGYNTLFFSIGLGARENLMYYPLRGIMDNRDRVNCWGVVNKPIRSNLVVARSIDRKRIAEAEEKANMSRMNLKDLEGNGLVAYASDTNYASRLIEQTSMASHLAKFEEVELVELDMLSSVIRTVSILKTENLGELVDFVLLMGRAA
jgi:hypothetical protein